MEIADMAPTPATQGGPVPGIPIGNGALISDNDDSFISDDTESEGDFGVGDNADDDGDGGKANIPNEGARRRGPEVNIPNEGAPGPDNFATDGEGCCRSTRAKIPIERFFPDANTLKSYPEFVWKSNPDGKLERFNLWLY
jgi:hypothetical protein